MALPRMASCCEKRAAFLDPPPPPPPPPPEPPSRLLPPSHSRLATGEHTTEWADASGWPDACSVFTRERGVTQGAGRLVCVTGLWGSEDGASSGWRPWESQLGDDTLGEGKSRTYDSTHEGSGGLFYDSTCFGLKTV